VIARWSPRPAGGGELTPALAETHVSLLIFAGDRACKLKKTVRTPFLDFSSAELRRAACEREVELNRRLAPARARRGGGGAVPRTGRDGSCGSQRDRGMRCSPAGRRTSPTWSGSCRNSQSIAYRAHVRAKRVPLGRRRRTPGGTRTPRRRPLRRNGGSRPVHGRGVRSLARCRGREHGRRAGRVAADGKTGAGPKPGRRPAVRPLESLGPMGPLDAQDRLRRLLEAALQLTSENSTEIVLGRIVEIAAELTGTRYAALGVIAPDGGSSPSRAPAGRWDRRRPGRTAPPGRTRPPGRPGSCRRRRASPPDHPAPCRGPGASGACG
jgi:hypothetical protein